MRTDRSYIGVKRMGELDHTPFMDYCMKKYPGDEAKIKFAELIRKWEDQAAAIVDGKEQVGMNVKSMKSTSLFVCMVY